MNAFLKFFVILSLFIIQLFFDSCSPPSNFRERPYMYNRPDKEKFNIDPLVFFDSDSLKARLDLYLEIPSENLFFKNNLNKNKYELKIDISIDLKTKDNEKYISNTYNIISEFSENEMKNISGKPLYYFYNYTVEPGKYNIDIKIKDNNSDNEFKKSTETEVIDWGVKEIAFSNLMILSNYKVNENDLKEITPLVGNNIFGLKEFFIFFEIYNRIGNEVSKEYIYKLKDNKNNIVKEDLLKYTLYPGKNRKVENITLFKELKKYMPEEPDFDFSPYTENKNRSFKLEISDKSNNDIVAVKNLLFVPGRNNFKMQRKPPMH